MKMTRAEMHRGRCKVCGGAFWESYLGARGEDLCDAHLEAQSLEERVLDALRDAVMSHEFSVGGLFCELSPSEVAETLEQHSPDLEDVHPSLIEPIVIAWMRQQNWMHRVVA